MPRKGPVAKRDVLPDPLYNSKLVTRLINKMMVDGKRGKSQEILYSAFDTIRERTGKEPMEVFEAALKNIMPVLEVKARRVGGANYQVPVEVRPDRRSTLGLRWLVNYSRNRGEKTMEERLANEIMDAANNTGASVKKREDTPGRDEYNLGKCDPRWFRVMGYQSPQPRPLRDADALRFLAPDGNCRGQLLGHRLALCG
jgi:small subunit ribosomal protein S7